MTEQSGIFAEGKLTFEAVQVLLKIGELENAGNKSIRPENVEESLRSLSKVNLSLEEVNKKIKSLANVGLVTCNRGFVRNGKITKEIEVFSLTMEGHRKIEIITDGKCT